jgi:hypothetical protein
MNHDKLLNSFERDPRVFRIRELRVIPANFQLLRNDAGDDGGDLREIGSLSIGDVHSRQTKRIA